MYYTYQQYSNWRIWWEMPFTIAYKENTIIRSNETWNMREYSENVSRSLFLIEVQHLGGKFKHFLRTPIYYTLSHSTSISEQSSPSIESHSQCCYRLESVALCFLHPMRVLLSLHWRMRTDEQRVMNTAGTWRSEQRLTNTSLLLTSFKLCLRVSRKAVLTF
jgi:hypothetical protein